MAADYAFDGTIIHIVNGTSGSPRNFQSLWVWDISNAATLLAAVDVETGPFSVTVRPAELIAIKIDVVLAGCTFGGAQTVTVTGDDSEGNSQTDVIDVSGGNATYSTNLSFSAVDAGGITVQGITVGTIAVTQYRQGVIGRIYSNWDFTLWRVYYQVYIGNNTDSTYLKSFSEVIVFSDPNCRIKANATVEVGRTVDAGGTNSTSQVSMWVFPGREFIYSAVFVDDGALYGYGATFMWQGGDTIFWEDGAAYLYNCTLVSDGGFQVVLTGMTTFEYENLTLVRMELDFGNAPTAGSKNLILQKGSFIQLSYIDGTIPGINNIDASTPVLEVKGNDYNTYMLDPVVLITNAKASAQNDVMQRFTCNLHIVNEDGANLTGVEVKCYNDINSSGSYTLDWTATTGADGKLTTTKYVKHSYWYNVNGGPTTTYYPHKFTFTKTGYVGLTLENVQINAPIEPDWRIEMSLTTADLVSAAETALGNKKVDTAAKVLVNKAIQNKSTGAIDYYNDAGAAVVLTHTPSDDGTDITRTPI